VYVCGMLGVSVCFPLCLLALSVTPFVYSQDEYKTYDGTLKNFCFPAKCADGACYCSDSHTGWWNGGAWKAGDVRCYRAGRGDCPCGICGKASTQCLDLRCDDNSYIEGTKCYTLDSSGNRVYSDKKLYDYCYYETNECQTCGNFGEHKVGCGRTDPGECKPCEDGLAYGKFWKAKGSCDQVDCSIPGKGYYIHGACSTTKDAAIKKCTDFEQNKGVGNYYCPGNSVPLKMPDNSLITADWSDFVCNGGFYRSENKCVSCPAGSCCKDQVKHSCPEHYFAQPQQSSCTKCSLTCADDNQLRRKCGANSIQNQVCISCGMCGSWPSTGYNCVTNPQDYAALTGSCCPCGT
jgi:hypothetical protein